MVGTFAPHWCYIHGASGSIAIHSESILKGQADCVPSPVEEAEQGSDRDDVSTNGHPNGGSVDRDTFVQGHSKDVHVGTGGENHAQRSEEVERGEDGDNRDGLYEEEEDDEEAEEDADEDEDEEEEEPALKYERLGGAVTGLLEKDSASAVAVSVKFLVCLIACHIIRVVFQCKGQVIGTHSGIVHVLDYLGNRIRSYRPHSASINEICVDTTSDFIGTASVDGMPSLNHAS